MIASRVRCFLQTQGRVAQDESFSQDAKTRNTHLLHVCKGAEAAHFQGRQHTQAPAPNNNNNDNSKDVVVGGRMHGGCHLTAYHIVAPSAVRRGILHDDCWGPQVRFLHVVFGVRVWDGGRIRCLEMRVQSKE